ncbi:MAG: hypothetical protein MR430_08935 [Lachnospiraceae bacterium]|nr:hypothetical protein [Lachnospiraceae bacterium]
MTGYMGTSLPGAGSKKQTEGRPAFQEGQSLGAYVMDCIYSMQEEGRAGETKEAYAARVYAKARAGKKLTPEEMNFLARTDPALYQKVLRVQALKRSLESRLKSCQSKQEAEEVFSIAVSSISEMDPDREMILAALEDTYREFKKSDEYRRLPERPEKEDRRNGMALEMNEKGYQELYLLEGTEFSFTAKG